MHVLESKCDKLFAAALQLKFCKSSSIPELDNDPSDELENLRRKGIFTPYFFRNGYQLIFAVYLELVSC